ncbi:MAG: alanine racemase [Oscillospiraceae bacterium]|jgi:alanine racemase|nr:alanine racemase [Oscillospiraceae bacterium]
MDLTFFELVACTGGATSYEGDDFALTGIRFDSRLDMKGAAFAAFVTDKGDGHEYVSVAVGKGALALIVSKDVGAAVPTVTVSDTLKAYQDIAAFYRGKFSTVVVALTGSNGKTTVKDMLSAVLSVKYKTMVTEKNLNNEIGVAQTLLNLDETHDVAVVEMGMNHKGEIRTLTNMAKPDIAVITKIGSAHAGNLGGTRRDVYDAKMEIAEGLKENGTLVLCGDDDMLSETRSDRHNIVFSGLNDDGRNLIRASDIRQFWDDGGFGLGFTAHYQGKERNCVLPVIGRHNVQNALLALTVGVKLGVDFTKAADALRAYPRSSMRLETAVIGGIRFIKDYYNASPESTEAAIDTLAELGAGGSRVAIIGDMLELGGQSAVFHRQIAEYTKGKADKVYYVGEYRDAFLAGRGDSNCFAAKAELNSALSSAVLNGGVKPGDAVLIKGSNGVKLWEQYEFIRKLLERGSAITAQTQLLVDIDALKHNYAAVRNYVGDGVRVMPVIKADAYGSGVGLLANIYGGCDFFAVADLRESEEFHRIMPNARFLVLYQPFIEEVDWVAERDYVVASVGDADFARKLNEAAARAGGRSAVHIEVDTGMSRLGAPVERCGELARVLSECKNLTVEGIYTHYSSADMYSDEDLDFTETQTRKFKDAIKIAESAIGDIRYKHACAGAAIFNPKAELFNMVRPGYILRGYYPCEEIKGKIELRPALKYVTKITQIKEYGAGTSVSYGRSFVTARKTRLAEIPAGYSDGLMRGLSNKGAFVVNGQLAPIAGNITMDYTMIDVTDISPAARVGDEVAIFDNVNMTIERMAELCGTIGYEVITNIRGKADRVERF